MYRGLHDYTYGSAVIRTPGTINGNIDTAVTFHQTSLATPPFSSLALWIRKNYTQRFPPRRFVFSVTERQ